MPTKKQTELTQARVLVASSYGQPDDVVSLDADQLKAAKQSGLVDANPDAVEYALSLKKD